MAAATYWSSDDEFGVEEILAWRYDGERKRREFLIQWEGYPPLANSWEPEENLVGCRALLMEFLRMRRLLPPTPMSRENQQPSPKCSSPQPPTAPHQASASSAAASSASSGGEATPSSDTESDIVDPRAKKAKIRLSSREAQFLEGMTRFQKMLDSVPGALLRVANSVNHETPPADFRYISSFVYGNDVPRPDPAFLVGCDCGPEASCSSKACACVNQHGQADARHAANYTADGRLKMATATRQPFIYECNERCACARSGKCLNRVIQHGRTVPLEIFQMGDARGWGVRAIQHIPAGTFIDLYYGEIITDAEADDRFRRIYRQDGRSIYLFDLDFSADSGAKADYTVDAYNCGSVSRFFNHSCSPNLLIAPCFIEHIDQSLHFVAFFAARGIEPDEELCFDYINERGRAGSHGPACAGRRQAKVYETGLVACLCGSPKCRKFVYPSNKT